MMRIVIFGVRGLWPIVKNVLREDIEVTGFLDNNIANQEIDLLGGGILLPDRWQNLRFDKIMICNANWQSKFDMMNQLLSLGVPKDRIGFVEELHICYDCKMEAIAENVIRIHQNGVMIDCRNSTELMIVEQNWLGGTYEYHTNEKGIVIDIGANIGDTAIYFAGKKEIVKVYGFEPSRQVYERAVENIALNEKISDKIQMYNYGLSDNNAIETYIEHENPTAGFHPDSGGATDNRRCIELEMKKASEMLQKIFEQHTEQCVLKMDCEGAEYKILEDIMESGIIERVNTIVMEWHSGDKEYLIELLEKSDFDFVINVSPYRGFGICYAWRK